MPYITKLQVGEQEYTVGFTDSDVSNIETDLENTRKKLDETVEKVDAAVAKIDTVEAPTAEKVSYDDTSTNLNVSNLQNAIEALNAITSMYPVIYLTQRWLRFDPANKKGLIIKAGTKIKNANGIYITFQQDTSFDMSSYISTEGTDYFVYMDNDGSLSAYDTHTTLENKVYIGRFHTLCVAVGSIEMIAPYSPGLASDGMTYLVKSYREDEDPDFYAFYNKTVNAISTNTTYDVVTVQHPLNGYIAGDILPESVFCLTWHPDCLKEDAMVYDKDTDIAVDIYLASGTSDNTTSKYNATHTVTRSGLNMLQDMLQVGKKLLSDYQFSSIAIGSNERTNIIGSEDKTTVGGHVDTENRRMISAIGVEEACGYLWQYLDELGPSGSSWSSSADGSSEFGQSYGTAHIMIAGGRWGHGKYCGSRCRANDAYLSTSDSRNGNRGSCLIHKGL